MTQAKRRAPEIDDATEARIQAGIRADPDNPELTEADFARAVPAREFFTPKQLAALGSGRPLPRGAGRKPTKLPVKLRLDADVVDAFKAEGEGWQTRMNDVLRRSIRGKRAKA